MAHWLNTKDRTEEDINNQFIPPEIQQKLELNLDSQKIFL